MDKIVEFFSMGGYAEFVWPAYGIAALVLAVLFVVSWRSYRSNEETLSSLQSSGLGRRARRPSTASTAPSKEVPDDA